MPWLPAEPLTPGLLLAPRPAQRETGRYTGRLGLAYLGTKKTKRPHQGTWTSGETIKPSV